MTNKELKRLKKLDLLELLLTQSRENEQLKQQLEEAQAQLSGRQLDLEQAGSIAEAALQLSGIFQTAQDAADQYEENIRRRSEQLLAETQARCEAMEEAARETCRRLIEEAEQKLPDAREGMNLKHEEG